MRRFFRNAPLPPAILPTKKRTPHGRFANNFRISAGAAAGVASVRRGFQWARSCVGCFRNIPAPLTESGRLRISRAGKSGRFVPPCRGRKKNRPFKKACFLSRLRGLPSRPLRGDASPPEPARAGAYKSPFRSQMSSAYSRMVLSDEKKPILAVLFMAIFAQRFLSRNASSTFCWTSQYDW